MPIQYEVLDVLLDKRPLFHCISQDLHMGRGVAKQVREQVGGVDLIRSQNHTVGKAVAVTINNRLIFHLITKLKYHHKPSLSTMRSCLLDLRAKLLEMNIYLIKAPKFVGSARDRLPWRSVLKLVEEILSGSGIQVVFCALPNTPQGELMRRS